MPTIRCDQCDTELLDVAVRDGWCETCGKRIPEYLLRERAERPAPAEPEPLPTGDVEFHIPFRTRLTAFLVMIAASGACWFVPIWVVTHPTQQPAKQWEDVFAISLGGFLGLVSTSAALARLRAGRIVVGERDIRHTRAFLGGFGPFVVTDVIPFAEVERFGFGYTAQDTDFFVIPNVIPTVLLRARGVDHRFVLKEYDRVDRFLALLLARVKQKPETIRPGWHGLGKFFKYPPGGGGAAGGGVGS